MSKFFNELKRRNVFKVAAVYAIASWLLLQVVDVLFPALKLPEWTITFVAALLIIGLPIALILAWAFEITPEGVKLEKDVDQSKSITPQTGQKLNYWIIGLLVAALGISVYFNVMDDETSDGADSAENIQQSIAVLPFVDLSPERDQEYFSDGISEELLNVLVRVKNLRVASRTSSFSFKDKNASIPEIAEELDVGHVLEGSVRKSGNKVRITAQLIDVASDSHLWAESYDRELTDIFAIQQEIAENIVDALKVALGTGETPAMAGDRKPTDNLEAYELYLQGRYFLAKRGADNLNKAADRLEQAVALDPSFSDSWGALAKTLALLPAYDVEADVQATLSRCDTAIEKALELNPNNTDALIGRGYMESTYRMGWDIAGAAYERALSINPNDVGVQNFYGDYLTVIGDYENSEKTERRAVELDPLASVHKRDLSELLLILDRPQEALPLMQRAVDLQPSFENYDVLMRVQLDLGDIEGAAESLRRLEQLPNINDNDRAYSRAHFYYGKGEWEKARPDYESLKALAESGQGSSVDMANIAFDLDGMDEALEFLELAYEGGGGRNLTWPAYFYLPEDRSDDARWLAFWEQPGLKELIESRRYYLAQRENGVRE